MTADELTGTAAALDPETPLERALKPDRVPTLFPDLPLDNALPYFPAGRCCPSRIALAERNSKASSPSTPSLSATSRLRQRGPPLLLRKSDLLSEMYVDI